MNGTTLSAGLCGRSTQYNQTEVRVNTGPRPGAGAAPCMHFSFARLRFHRASCSKIQELRSCLQSLFLGCSDLLDFSLIGKSRIN